MGHLNVAGWTVNNRSLREAIIKHLNLHIFCICETHLNKNDNLNVEGYTWFGHCRFGKHKKAPKTFGGVGIFIRNDILMEYLISIVDQSFDGILILKCKHKFSDFVFIICEAYLAPENSPWGRDAS